MENGKMEQDYVGEEAINNHYVNHRNAINTYSNVTPEEWYKITGETVKSGETIVYTNDYGGDWIISIE